MKPLFNGTIKKGKLYLADMEQFNQYISNFEGKDVHISVGIPRKDRSSEQNRYYWGCVVEILQKELGYETKEMMHDALRMTFLKVHYTDKPPTIKSTTELSTVEFEEYLSQVRQWASQEGIYIPLPNEVDFD